MTVKTVGLDLAKDVFQVHGISETGRRIINKKIKRVNLLAFFEALPRCVVGMEACGSAHHWGRALRKLGHDVRLMPFFATNAPPERSLDARTLCQALCEAWQNGRGRRRGDL
jgi:transposase